MVRIKTVEPKDDFTLRLTFTDGKSGIFDVKPYLTIGNVFAEIANPSVFKNVKVAHGTIEWANGVDLCPDSVYLETKFA